MSDVNEVTNVQEVQNLTVSGGEETQGGQIRLVVAMAGAVMIDVPAEGIKVSQLPNYDPTKTYTFGGMVRDADFVLLPGQVGIVAKAHSNGTV
jgi:hypothetical protein